jgi:hypothetical protein
VKEVAEGYKKYRRHNKIYELPASIRAMLDDMLRDTSIPYIEISEWLKKEGYDISKSTIGRYSLETKKLAYKLAETREQVKELVQMIRASNDDGENLTEGALQIATHKLTEKIAVLDTEIDDMDATDAIKLMLQLSRTKAYKDKVYFSFKKDVDKAYDLFKKSVYAELEAYPDICEKLIGIADNTLGKIAADN